MTYLYIFNIKYSYIAENAKLPITINYIHRQHAVSGIIRFHKQYKDQQSLTNPRDALHQGERAANK